MFSAPDNRQIRIDIAISNRPCQGKTLLKPRLVIIIEKQATNPTGLVAVFEEKVLVTPLFETGINLRTKGLAGGTGRLVPMTTIFLIAVVGG